MRKIIGWSVAALGLAASIVTIVAARDAIWSWLYPLPLVALLSAALAASWAYVWIGRSKPSTGDQQRLDRLLSVLPREAMR